MPDMKYHLAEEDGGTLKVIFGSKRPAQVPKDELTAKRRALIERWIPDGVKIIETRDTEEEANKKLQELLNKRREAAAKEAEKAAKPDGG